MTDLVKDGRSGGVGRDVDRVDSGCNEQRSSKTRDELLLYDS